MYKINSGQYAIYCRLIEKLETDLLSLHCMQSTYYGYSSYNRKERRKTNILSQNLGSESGLQHARATLVILPNILPAENVMIRYL